MGILNIFKKGKSAEAEAASAPRPKQEERKKIITDSFAIKKMHVSEKAADLHGQNKYVFFVDRRSNKPEIRKNIEAAYGVEVKDINMMNVKGKVKRLGRSAGKTPDYKKAIVSLASGNKIEIT